MCWRSAWQRAWQCRPPRLRLRPMRRDDTEALFLVFCDAQAMRYWSSPPHGSPLLTAEVIERAQMAFIAGDGIEWAITRVGDDAAVGKIGHWRWQGWKQAGSSRF